MTRAQKPLTPLHPPKRIRVADLTFRLARGQIHSTTAAWLILPDRSLPKPKLAREAFPKPPKAAGIIWHSILDFLRNEMKEQYHFEYKAIYDNVMDSVCC